MFRQITLRSMLVLALAVGFLVAIGTQQAADAVTITFDANDDSHAVFAPGTAITISGDLAPPAGNSDGCLDDFGTAAADLYILPHGVVDPGTTTALGGTPNATIVSGLTAGLFTDETIGWAGSSSTTAAGDYDIVVDRCTDGQYDPRSDYVDGAGSPDGAFTVTAPAPGTTAIDFTALKDAFKPELQYWQDLALYLIRVNEAAHFYKFAKAVQKTIKELQGPLLKKLEGVKDFAALASGAQKLVSCATTVIGNDLTKIISYIANCADIRSRDPLTRFKSDALREVIEQVKHYNDLIDDPPDTNYRALVTAPATTYDPPDPNDAVVAATTRVGNAVSVQQSASEAMLQSLERYEGAVAAHDPQAQMDQAQSVSKYANAAADRYPAVDAAITGLPAAISADGVDLDGTAAQLTTVQSDIGRDGLDADTVQALVGAGLSDAEISRVQSLAATSLPIVTSAQLATAISGVTGSDSAVVSSLRVLAQQADSTAATAGAGLTPVNPTADAGTGYTGSAGHAVTFDASGSTTPSSTGPLDYAWDLTGSGTFSDAAGPVVTHTYPSGYSGEVGVRVTNSAGAQDVSYAPLQISAASPPTSVMTPGAYLDLVTGQSQTFTASSTDSSATWEWDLDGAQVATSPSYVASFTTAGQHFLTLTASDAAGSSSTDTEIDVSNPVTLSAIAVAPTSPTVEPGATVNLQAAAEYTQSGTADLTSAATWESSNPAAATVDSTGQVTGVATGYATITATVGTVSGSTLVTVRPAAPTAKTVIRLAFDQTNPTLTAGGRLEIETTATYFDQSTADVTAQADWTTDRPDIATVSGGLVDAVGPGIATITARLDGISASTRVIVPGGGPSVLSAVTVSPGNQDIPIAGKQQFRATGTYSDGTVSDLTSIAAWASADPSLVSISSDGLATAKQDGATTVTATLDGVTGNAAATAVDAPPPDLSNTIFVAGGSTIGKITVTADGYVTQNSFALLDPGSTLSGGMVYDHEGDLVVYTPWSDIPGGNTLTVVDSHTGAIIKRIPLGIGGYGALAMDPTRDSVYIADYGVNGGCLCRVDLADGTMTVLGGNPTAATRVPGEVYDPRSIAFSPDDRLWVGEDGDTEPSGILEGRVSEVDPATGTVLRSVAVPSQPRSIGFDPSRGTLLLGSQDSGCVVGVGAEALVLAHAARAAELTRGDPARSLVATMVLSCGRALFRGEEWKPDTTALNDPAIQSYLMTQMPVMCAGIAQTLIWLGQPELSDALRIPLIDAARRAGALSVLPYPLTTGGEQAWWVGEWERGKHQLAEAIEIADAAGQPVLQGFAAGLQAQFAAAQGDRSQLAAALDRADRRGAESGIAPIALYTGRARIHDALARGDAATAVALGRVTHRRAKEVGVAGVMQVPYLPDYAEAAVRSHAPEAHDLVEELAGRAEARHPGYVQSAVLSLQAQLAGPAKRADDLFEAALSTSPAKRAPFEHARILQRAAEHRIRRRGDRTRAAAELTQALQVYDMLNATPWRDGVLSALRAAGRPAARDRRTASPSPGGRCRSAISSPPARRIGTSPRSCS